jgi:hypothetical protein
MAHSEGLAHPRSAGVNVQRGADKRVRLSVYENSE